MSELSAIGTDSLVVKPFVYTRCLQKMYTRFKELYLIHTYFTIENLQYLNI